MDKLLALANGDLFVLSFLGLDDPLLGFPGGDMKAISGPKDPIQESGQCAPYVRESTASY